MSINRNIQIFRAQNNISKSTVCIPKKNIIYAQRPTSGLPEVQNLGLEPLSVQMTPVCVPLVGHCLGVFFSKVQSQEGAQAHHDPISSDSP